MEQAWDQVAVAAVAQVWAVAVAWAVEDLLWVAEDRSRITGWL